MACRDTPARSGTCLRATGFRHSYLSIKWISRGRTEEKSLAELREQLSPDIYWFPEEGLEAAAEDLAALDENLLERYLETGYDEKLWYGRTAELIRSAGCFPVFPAAR